jgi:hypothetical protein
LVGRSRFFSTFCMSNGLHSSRVSMVIPDWAILNLAHPRILWHWPCMVWSRFRSERASRSLLGRSSGRGKGPRRSRRPKCTPPWPCATRRRTAPRLSARSVFGGGCYGHAWRHLGCLAVHSQCSVRVRGVPVRSYWSQHGWAVVHSQCSVSVRGVPVRSYWSQHGWAVVHRKFCAHVPSHLRRWRLRCATLF